MTHPPPASLARSTSNLTNSFEERTVFYSTCRDAIGSAPRGRMVRCRRPRAAGTMTDGYDGVGCSVFLNNRYMDPQTGVFLSVDPMVSRTGTAYLSGAGNPTTLSDPTGLEPGCGATAFSSSSCRDAYTATSNACILSRGCSGQSLVDSIHDTKDGLGGAVFSGVEGADVNGNLDGNWGKKSIDAAAAGGDSLLGALRAMGVPEDQLAFFAALVASAGQRLQGHKSAYERIDVDTKHGFGRWWDDHGATVLAVASIAVAVVALVATGGAAFLGAGFIVAGEKSLGTIISATTVAGLTLDGAGMLNSCVLGNGSCTTAAITTGIDAATLGLGTGMNVLADQLVTDSFRFFGAADDAMSLFTLTDHLGTAIAGVSVANQVVSATQGYGAK